MEMLFVMLLNLINCIYKFYLGNLRNQILQGKLIQTSIKLKLIGYC
jgi:hypothetical protein